MHSQSHTHLLVLRFSAMGDVAMTVPVIKDLLQQYPQLSITFASDKKFEALFKDIPRLYFFPADLKGKHAGAAGMFRLYKEITREKKFDAVADLHDVLRTKLITVFFRMAGTRVFKINKGRAEKRKLTRKKGKELVQLTSTFQRYANVFAKAGVPVLLKNTGSILYDKKRKSPTEIKIGLAPFAKHKEKMYELARTERVLEWLSDKKYQIYLFGGSNEEATILSSWEKKYKGVINIGGKFSLEEELKQISQLDLMISMDSANMHLASLFNVPVISIWGATHPFLGFYGYGQDPQNIVQVELYCRPCSVFGNKKCYRGDHACMQMINPEQVISKVEMLLGS